jgi:hypothetical protein
MEEGDVIDAVLQQVRETLLLVLCLRTAIPGRRTVVDMCIVRGDLLNVNYVGATWLERERPCRGCSDGSATHSRGISLFPVSALSADDPQRGLCRRVPHPLPAHLPRAACERQWLLGPGPHHAVRVQCRARGRRPLRRQDWLALDRHRQL